MPKSKPRLLKKIETVCDLAFSAEWVKIEEYMRLLPEDDKRAIYQAVLEGRASCENRSYRPMRVEKLKSLPGLYNCNLIPTLLEKLQTNNYLYDYLTAQRKVRG